MEEQQHLRENIPPQNSDPECRSELTRTVSNAAGSSSSSVALATHAHAAPKNVQGPHSTQELPFKTHNSSEQINFPRNENLLESTADSHVTLPSPWICHFTAAGKKFNMASPNLRAHTLSSNNSTHPRRNTTIKESSVTARISEHNPACHQYSVGRTAEVLGQNFADEDHRGKLSCEFIPKRLKRASGDASSTDQVMYWIAPKYQCIVPLKSETAQNTLPKGEEQAHHHLLLAHPDTFICPKSIFTCS